MDLLRKLQCLTSRSAHLTIYKTFVRPHLDYVDIIYEKAHNSSFYQKIESAQYNACLVITSAIKGTSKEKLYDKLGLESLQLRHWFGKLCYFYKFYKNESPRYLSKLVPLWQSLKPLEILKTHPFSKENITFSKIIFFLSAVIEWNNLGHNIWNVGSFIAFKNNILKLIRPTPTFLIVKIIEESNLLQDCLLALVICVNRNSNSFQDTLNPICSWGLDVESTYYILRCPMYNDERHTLLSTMKTSILDC